MTFVVERKISCFCELSYYLYNIIMLISVFNVYFDRLCTIMYKYYILTLFVSEIREK